jgi:hypothetical protein
MAARLSVVLRDLAAPSRDPTLTCGRRGAGRRLWRRSYCLPWLRHTCSDQPCSKGIRPPPERREGARQLLTALRAAAPRPDLSLRLEHASGSGWGEGRGGEGGDRLVLGLAAAGGARVSPSELQGGVTTAGSRPGRVRLGPPFIPRGEATVAAFHELADSSTGLIRTLVTLCSDSGDATRSYPPDSGDTY